MSNPTLPPEVAAKVARISACILANVADGMSLPDAVDAVLGPRAYVRLAGTVYTSLRGMTDAVSVR